VSYRRKYGEAGTAGTDVDAYRLQSRGAAGRHQHEDHRQALRFHRKNKCKGVSVWMSGLKPGPISNAKATADPYGMTNKRSKGKYKYGDSGLRQAQARMTNKSEKQVFPLHFPAQQAGREPVRGRMTIVGREWQFWLVRVKKRKAQG
jgi:hypothetical protein